MANDQKEVELPADLRQKAIEQQIPLGLVVEAYRRGFAAQIGATGRFPYGDLGKEDEGELAMAIAADPQHGVVRMLFGKPVGWLALPAGHARQLGAMLTEKANELERKLS